MEYKKLFNVEDLFTLEVTTSVSVRTNLSIHHLQSSRLFAKMCRELEEKDDPPHWPSGLWEKSKSYATASIILAVAGLEAFINEFFLDASEHDTSLLPFLGEEKVAQLADCWQQEERSSILKKYQAALVTATGSEMDKSVEPFQSANLLVGLRNKLVHFIPEWDTKSIEHANLEKRLKGKFASNAFMARSSAQSAWFPNHCLGTGAAEWAYKTASGFLSEFCNQMGIDDRSPN